MKNLLILIAAATAAWSATAVATEGGEHAPAADAAPRIPVEERAKTCAACHGADGNQTLDGTYPRLAGQYESYLEHALKEYRAGRRENPIMAAQVSTLSDQDIAELAHYFSQLPGQMGTANRYP